MKKARFFILALTAAAWLPAAALAQPKVTEGVDAKGEPLSEKYYLTAPNKVGMTLLRNPALGEGGFVIRLSAFDGISGCPRLGNFNTETTYDNMYADVKLGSYTVDMRNMPLDPNKCRKDLQVPRTDVVMDKDQLRAQGITKIRFHYGVFTDTYDIEIGDNFVRLEPTKQFTKRKNTAKIYSPQVGYNSGSPMELRFLPSDTVVLYAPSVPSNMDAASAIEALATGRGLVPLRAEPGLPLPAGTPRAYYFTDPQNTVLGKLDGDTPQSFGTVEVSKTVYGLQGNEVASKGYDVYMKKPSLHE
jgi:hypothetical protein